MKINIDKGYPIDFHIDMGTVSKEGFNFWVNINSPKAFYSLVINWFATVDSNI